MSWHAKYFVKIDGIAYKAALLDHAQKLAESSEIGLPQAKELWEAALDGPGATTTERRTLCYILENFALSPEAKTFLRSQLGEETPCVAVPSTEAGPEPYPATDHPLSTWLLRPAARAWQRFFGRSAEQELLSLAAKHAKDGCLHLRAAQVLWQVAFADGHLAEAAERTLKRIAQSFALDEAAEAFLSHKLVLQESAGLGCGPSYLSSSGAEGTERKRRKHGAFTAVFCNPGHGSGARKQLAEVLGSASRTLDVALFVLTDDFLASVLLQRHEAGVKVRMLADNGAEEIFKTSDLDKLRHAGIEVRLDHSKLHMHHKFAVIDDEVCVNGSLNWTTGALRNNRENIVINRCTRIAHIFSAEFQRLWTAFAPGVTSAPGPAPTAVWHGGCSVLFFPDAEDANFEKLVAEVRLAKKSLDVAVFTLTVSELKGALKDAHSCGVRVRVITDDRQAKFVGAGSHLKELRHAGVDVRTDGAGSMHHKFCVIDGHTVCNGSFNWTRQAEDGNNENVIIYCGESGLAHSFTTEFQRLWDEFDST